MLLVVLGHVLMVMGIEDHDTVLSRLLVSFRMPLFFFVSGYFSYRSLTWWTKSRVKDILNRKLKAQILCTIVFLSTFQYINRGYVDLFAGFGGYWFTIVLFQMYLLYLISNLLSRYIRRDIVIPVLIIISIIGIGIFARKPVNIWIWDFLVWSKLANYMQFFTLGIICSKYNSKFFALLSTNKFKTIVIIGWIITMLLWHSNFLKETFPLFFTVNFNLTVRYFGLLCVIMIFFSHASTLSRNNRFCLILRFIGRRTLDIYMIHFFFLPNLKFLYSYVIDDFVLQLIISGFFTIIISGLCLIVSQILRQSNTLSIWLFGERKQQKELAQAL